MLLVAMFCVLSVSVFSVQAGVSPCAKKGGTQGENGQCQLLINARVSVDYPLDLAQNLLIASTIDSFIQATKNDFLQVGFVVSGNESLDITYETIQHSENIVSLVFTVYTFLGGAHRMRTVRTYTFDTVNNRVLTLDDLFTNTTDALTLIAPIAQTTILKNLGSRHDLDDVQRGTVVDPRNYAAFSLDADSIIFYFQQGVIDSYAGDVQTVRIPLIQLSSVLKREFAA